MLLAHASISIQQEELRSSIAPFFPIEGLSSPSSCAQLLVLLVIMPFHMMLPEGEKEPSHEEGNERQKKRRGKESGWKGDRGNSVLSPHPFGIKKVMSVIFLWSRQGKKIYWEQDEGYLVPYLL
jgi:hypothetical protein